MGGLGMLTRLEPYRPIFMGAGGAALLYVVWRAWRPAPTQAGGAACADESCARDSSRRRRTRQLVTIAALLCGLAIAYPYAIEALL